MPLVPAAFCFLRTLTRRYRTARGSSGRSRCFAPYGGEGGEAFAPSRATAAPARRAARVSLQPAGRDARISRAWIGRRLSPRHALGLQHPGDPRHRCAHRGVAARCGARAALGAHSGLPSPHPLHGAAPRVGRPRPLAPLGRAHLEGRTVGAVFLGVAARAGGAVDGAPHRDGQRLGAAPREPPTGIAQKHLLPPAYAPRIERLLCRQV